MARLMRAHLLLTALLLSAHLYHTEARLAQGRWHGRGRVEAGPETDADTLPDAWDRRLLQDAPPSSPALPQGAIIGISVVAGLLVGALVGGTAVWAKMRKTSAKQQVAAITERREVKRAVAAVQESSGGKAAGNYQFDLYRQAQLIVDVRRIKVMDEVRRQLSALRLPSDRESELVAKVMVEVFDQKSVNEFVLGQSASKESLREVAPKLLQPLGGEIPGLRPEPFATAKAAASAVVGEWNKKLMDDFKGEQLSPENELMKKKLEALDAELKELTRQQNLLIKETVAAQAEIDRAAKQGDKEAEKKAEEEKARLDEEQKKKQAEVEKKAKERKKVVEERFGRG